METNRTTNQLGLAPTRMPAMRASWMEPPPPNMRHDIVGEALQRYAAGQRAARSSDDYVRATVILASVLFLVGISGHFPITGVRIGLISVGVALLFFAAGDILSLPRPP